MSIVWPGKSVNHKIDNYRRVNTQDKLGPICKRIYVHICIHMYIMYE